MSRPIEDSFSGSDTFSGMSRNMKDPARSLSQGLMDFLDPMDPFNRGFDAFLGRAMKLDPRLCPV